MSILEKLPDPSISASSALRVQTELGRLTRSAGALDGSNGESPLGELRMVTGELSTRVDIDMQPLAGGLSKVLVAMENALPANALAYVEALDQSYRSVVDLLYGSEIVRQIGEEQTLSEAAIAVIDDALRLFDRHVADLAANLVGADRLRDLRATLAQIQALEAEAPLAAGDLARFLSTHLIGVAPDLLDAPLAHVTEGLRVLTPLADDALDGAVIPARTAVLTAYRSLLEAVNELDPADAAGYVRVTVHLEELAAANDLLFAALSTLYTEMKALIADHAWDAIFPGYVDLLATLDMGPVPTVDDVVRQLEAMVSELLARLFMIFDGDDLRSRIETLNGVLRDTMLTSPLGQIKPAIEAFLEHVRDSIDAVPVEEVQRIVARILENIQSAMAHLDLEQLQAEIESALDNVESFAAANLGTPARNMIQAAMDGLAAQLNRLPLDTLISDLEAALDQFQRLVADLENALQASLEELRAFLQQAETLSFKPVSDAVVAEIDDLKQRLQAINPNALSDAERLALASALVVVEGIDLETQVVDGLKAGYAAAENEIRFLLNQIVATLQHLRDAADTFNPASILGPIGTALEDAGRLLEGMTVQALLAPLHAELEQVERRFHDMAPERLLVPLQAAYERLAALLARLDPASWTAPLEALYTQIDRLVTMVDITPLMDELDRKQRALFADARAAILAGFDALDLPAPLDSFLKEMRPLVELMTDAIFGDPDTELKRISLAVRDKVNLATLFAPLDELFLRMVAALERIPAADLTDVMNALRQGLGIGLDVLNPQAVMTQLRAGYGRLQELAPANLLAQTINLLSVKVIFTSKIETAPPARAADIVAVTARFEAVLSVVTPTVSGSQYAKLVEEHAGLLNAMRRRINQLDYASASHHYGRLRSMLDRLLPDFLRQPTPLSHAEIMAGLYRMRPSNKIAPIQETLARFLRQLDSYADAVEPAVNGFFSTLRDIMELVSPISLRDAVAETYAAVRARARLLDPGDLAGELRAILEPIKTAVETCSPAAIAARLQASFDRALQAAIVTFRTLLEEVAEIIDSQVRALRAALRALVANLRKALDTAAAKAQAILAQIEELLFVELLERLSRVVDNLGVSFDQELERVQHAFDEMIAAIPLDGRRQAGAGASTR